MADEKKTYLINFESNLKKYAEEAAEAKKKVDELTAANKALKESGTASAAEIEANNAALRNAQKEYTQAKKMIDLQTAANSSEIGSRKQLGEILKLQEQALGKLGSAYIKNAQGMDILNPKYIEQRNRIAATKQAIIDYDLALKDGRSNIGRYTESVGKAFGEVGTKMASMLGPAALVAAAVGLAKKIFEGLKDAIMSTTVAINVVNKIGAVTKQLFYDIAVGGRLNINNLIEASKIQGELNKLRVEEGFETLKLSMINREEQAVRELSIDRTKTHAERLVLLNKVKELEGEKTKITVEHLKDELNAKEKLLKQQPGNEKLLLNTLQLRARINDAYAAEDAAMRRIETQRTTFIQEEIDKRKKVMDDYLKWIDEENVRKDKLAEDAAKRELDEELAGIRYYEKLRKQVEQEGQLIDIKTIKNKGFFDIFKNLQEETVKTLQETNIQAAESDTRLAEIKVNNQEMVTSALTGGLDALSSILGKQTETGKAFAVASATIDTFAAAGKALNDPSIPTTWLRMAMMAVVILRGLANVKQILSVKVGKTTAAASMAPTAITSTPIMQRTYATTAGSTFFTQPQLTQTQLNTMPSQNLLTAEDIKDAISELTIVTTIEDINARQKSTNKIISRANI